MNYEDFYEKIHALEKTAGDKAASLQRSLKSAVKNSEKGDLRGNIKDLTQMKTLIDELKVMVTDMSELAESFDFKEYMDGGDFAKQMLEYCNELDVDVKGDYPAFDIFPYKVKIDGENGDIYVDRKKLHCLRPQKFVENIKQSRDKLMKSSFNANSFINELATAYKLAVTVKASKLNNTRAEYSLFLGDLYSYLAPMQRYRRDYDMQSYAYDLSRIYALEGLTTKDGLSYEFGSNKESKKFIRIIDENGKEQLISTIRFFEKKTTEQ